MYAYTVKVVTPVIAPRLPEQSVRTMIEKYGLREKYGEEADHLDRVFLRAQDLVTGVKKVYIPGPIIRAAIKIAANMAGKSTSSLNIIGAYFDEKDVIMYVSYIGVPKKPSLAVYEMILPGSTGVLYSEDRIEDHVQLPLVIRIGWMKTKGMGRVIIEPIKKEEK